MKYLQFLLKTSWVAIASATVLGLLGGASASNNNIDRGGGEIEGFFSSL